MWLQVKQHEGFRGPVVCKNYALTTVHSMYRGQNGSILVVHGISSPKAMLEWLEHAANASMRWAISQVAQLLLHALWEIG